jgi:hypothetical protein
MKSLLIVGLAVFLTGCSISVPVKRTFPNAPAELMEPCGELTKLKDGTTQLSDMLNVITENYGQYHECKIKNDLWINWYNQQKKTFDSVK